ncbi:MAG TPA: zf-HC2 domain-containing protein [Vicinamibacterales bacterium]|nr:zf-HC2 domain-containing protein [Vicinamibacterales bacterium]
MNTNGCGEHETLVGYLYDELNAGERAAFEEHLATCGECRVALEEMRGVRAELASWRVPERAFGFTIVPVADAAAPTADRTGRGRAARPWWASGALAAAAVVLLAVAAAIANLEITYGDGGVRVRTGWSQQPEPARQAAAAPQPSQLQGTAVSRDDLAALERRLRTEFRGVAAIAPPPASRTAGASAQANDVLLRRVQELIEQSELRQRRELALRVAQMVRDFDSQRQTDLVRIQQGLGQLEGNTAADRQLLNYLVRVSQRQ